MIWAIIGYAATRGRRDFSSLQTLDAASYEVQVEAAHLDRARQTLGAGPAAPRA